MRDVGRQESERTEKQSEAGFATDQFELVTAEPRAAILGALATYQGENPRSPSVGFTDLRRRAGIEDSGNFNYHLDKLQPAYVRQTEDGYMLTFAGMSLVGMFQAGVGTETDKGPVALDAACSICGTQLTATYENRLLSVTCENEHRFPCDGLPPNAVAGRTLREAISIQRHRTQHHLDLVHEGVCPACFDDIELEHDVLGESQAGHVFVAICKGCGWVSASSVGSYLLSEPAVVAFYYDHGVDVSQEPYWALELTVAEPAVRSEDPLRLSLSVERGDERLTLVVDERTQLLDSERTAPDP